MLLEGSCHCGAVRFTVHSRGPQPFAYCYCSICRKTAGGGGFAVNLQGDMDSLVVQGREHIGVYRPWMDHPARTERSPGERHFCRECGSALWVWDPRWPELVHPNASAVDTPLPSPPERHHCMLAFKPAWVPVPTGPNEHPAQEYPQLESLEAWHRQHGLWEDP